MTDNYVGTELDLFSEARNWKAYFGRVLGPFVRGRVLDVGAGIGSNIGPLMGAAASHWTALEPDPRQSKRIATLAAAHSRADDIDVRTGTLDDLAATETFDTILYVDVIEHIVDDFGEIGRAATHIAPGGSLVVLVPAFQILFSPFDVAVGHERRYTRGMLRMLTPPGCTVRLCRMLDCVGFMASAANRLLLQSSTPTRNQVLLWDRVMVPVSRVLDPLLMHLFGKSCVIVWTRDLPGGATSAASR